MRTSRPSPSINSGSMADIAFLLLIFFLVTTTISGDQGLTRKLPHDCPPGTDCSVPIPERNILRIMVNNENKIMIDNEDIIEINDLKDVVKDFIDNNGDRSCTFCNGKQNVLSSDNPSKAVISLQSGKLASYDTYIHIQDEITKAYYELRAQYAKNVLKKDVNDLNEIEVKRLKEAYPFILSEAETR